jgi:Protein of unknown function (DUF1488)
MSMALIRDQEPFEFERFDGVYFWMRDGTSPVLCKISHDALRDRAARDGEDESLENTFIRHRARIESIAGNNYNNRPLTGDVLLVGTEQLTPLPM